MPLPAWVVPAIQAVGAIGGSAVGMGIAKGKGKRQVDQQRALQNVQIEGNKQMMEEQYKMWQRTGPTGQIEEYKLAGLNPALMYGMAGGGGQSMGSPGTVTGGQAPGGSGNEGETMIGMGMQLASQLALMKAQKENIEADTKNKESQIPGHQAEAPLKGAQQTNIETDTKGKQLNNEFLQGSMTDRLSQVSSQAVQEIQKAQQMVNDTNVSDATIQDRIKQIKQNAIGKVLDNTLARIEQTVKNVNIQKAKAEIKAIAEYIEQGWHNVELGYRKSNQGERQTQQGYDKINIDRDKNAIMKHLGETGLDLQDRGQILQTITGIISMGTKIAPTTTEHSWWTEDNKGNWNQGHSTQKR